MTSLTDEMVAEELILKAVGLPSVVAALVDERCELIVGVDVGAEGLVAATLECHHHHHSKAASQPQNLYYPASFLKAHRF